MLARWNNVYNLTAVRDPAEMLTRHLLDSLAIAPLVRGDTLADLGTGAGFSVREILRAIHAETGRQVPSLVKPRRSGDPTYLVADPGAAREILQFRPAHSDLATIIRTAWAWHRKAHPLKAAR